MGWELAKSVPFFFLCLVLQTMMDLKYFLRVAGKLEVHPGSLFELAIVFQHEWKMILRERGKRY